LDASLRLIDPVMRGKLSYDDFRNRAHWISHELWYAFLEHLGARGFCQLLGWQALGRALPSNAPLLVVALSFY
jgi:hypothetical protein